MATLKNNLNKQLFTELTPTEGAIIRGGSNRAKITSISSNKSGADDDGGDELKMSQNYSLFWKGDMKTGQTKSIGKYMNGGDSISLLEDDYLSPSEWISRGTKLPSSGSIGQSGQLRLAGAGSDYTVNYEWH
jgi:hypothetical protein